MEIQTEAQREAIVEMARALNLNNPGMLSTAAASEWIKVHKEDYEKYK